MSQNLGQFQINLNDSASSLIYTAPPIVGNQTGASLIFLISGINAVEIPIAYYTIFKTNGQVVGPNPIMSNEPRQVTMAPNETIHGISVCGSVTLRVFVSDVTP